MAIMERPATSIRDDVAKHAELFGPDSLPRTDSGRLRRFSSKVGESR
jgi:hypothetical protein